MTKWTEATKEMPRLSAAIPPPLRSDASNVPRNGGGRGHHLSHAPSAVLSLSHMTIPSSVLRAVIALTMLFAAATSVLALVVLVVPSLYVIENQTPVYRSAASVLANHTSTTPRVMLLADFTIDVGITLNCFGQTCLSREQRTQRPLPTTVMDLLNNDQILPNMSVALKSLVHGGALDFTVFRGEVSCGSSADAGKTLRILIIVALAVASGSGLLGLIPSGAMLHCLEETGKIVSHLKKPKSEKRPDDRKRHTPSEGHTNKGANEETLAYSRAARMKEPFLLMYSSLWYFLCCGSMVAALILEYRLEGDILHCDGTKSMCDAVVGGFRSFASEALGSEYNLNSLSLTCDLGKGLFCLWAAMISSGIGLFCALVVDVLYACSRRRDFLRAISIRIEDVMRRSKLEELRASQVATRIPMSPTTRPIVAGGSLLSPPSESHQYHSETLVEGEELFRADSKDFSPFSASPANHREVVIDRFEEHNNRLFEEELRLTETSEHFLRAAIKGEEQLEFYSGFNLAKRKVWRSERVACLHEWSLEWYFGPLVDVHVEETFDRQVLIRKWYEKLLDQCLRFPPVAVSGGSESPHDGSNQDDGAALLQPFPLRLAPFDDTLKWASFYQFDDEAGEAAAASSPGVALRAIPYFHAEWMSIIDSPTRKFYANSNKDRGGSVEVSSETDEEDEPSDPLFPTTSAIEMQPFRKSYEQLIQRTSPSARGPLRRIHGSGTQQPAKGGEQPQGAVRVSPYQQLMECRALYPTSRGLFPPASPILDRSAVSGGQGTPATPRPMLLPSSSMKPLHSQPLDFKAVTQANEQVRRLYEQAMLRSSSRLNFGRSSSNASQHAARDFLASVSVGLAIAEQYPVVGGGLPAGDDGKSIVVRTPASSPNDLSHPTVDWTVGPSSAAWGEGAVKQRIAQLTRLGARDSDIDLR